MSKIKVLHIIKSLGRGGAEMLLPETLALHNKHEFEFHYIYFLPWKNQLVEALKANGGKVTCLSSSNNINLLTKYHKITQYCSKNNIDIIHAHLPWAGFVARLVHTKTKIPVVYTEHNLQERYHRVTRLLNKFSYNAQNLALGVSDDVTNSIINYIKPKIAVETLFNGVNTQKFKPDINIKNQIRNRLNIPKNALVIGNTAVFRFQKRLKLWLELMKTITDKHNNVYGILVGSGPLEQEIKRYHKKLNLNNKVILTGLKTNVMPYLQAMDIFMMTSSFEGLPVAMLEAMSTECAVVSTDAGGIKQIIRNEKDGLMVPVEQWQDIPQLIENLIITPQLLHIYKKNARKRVQNNFSLTQMVNNLEQTYITLTSNKQ